MSGKLLFATIGVAEPVLKIGNNFMMDAREKTTLGEKMRHLMASPRLAKQHIS
jgi:hypothetical protein